MQDDPLPCRYAHQWGLLVLSDVVADQIRRHRKRLGINRDQLAERCAEFGAPKLTTATITNIETGRPKDGIRRREISVDELVVLAKALGVPPILLLYPVGLRELTEVLPGRQAGTWAAAKWFTGEAPLPTQIPHGRWLVEGGDFDAWEKGGAPINLYRDHDKLIEKWNGAKLAAVTNRRAAEGASTDEERLALLRKADDHEGEARETEQALGWHRRDMRRHGITPPELTENLRHVDAERGDEIDEIDKLLGITRQPRKPEDQP